MKRFWDIVAYLYDLLLGRGWGGFLVRELNVEGGLAVWQGVGFFCQGEGGGFIDIF